MAEIIIPSDDKIPGAEPPEGPDFTELTLEILRERNKRQNIYQLDLAQTNPILMRHLSDPNFAAIAQDNVERLTLIEGAFTGVQNFPTFQNHHLLVPLISHLFLLYVYLWLR